MRHAEGGDMSNTEQDADEQQEQTGRLTYGSDTWSVASEPRVIETDAGYDLVEVWVKRGDGSGEPS
jgi:hypothetical protein